MVTILEVASMPNGLCESVSEKPPWGLITVVYINYYIQIMHLSYLIDIRIRINMSLFGSGFRRQFLRYLNLTGLHFELLQVPTINQKRNDYLLFNFFDKNTSLMELTFVFFYQSSAD